MLYVLVNPQAECSEYGKTHNEDNRVKFSDEVKFLLNCCGKCGLDELSNNWRLEIQDVAGDETGMETGTDTGTMLEWLFDKL
jgi:hypothetical protein